MPLWMDRGMLLGGWSGAVVTLVIWLLDGASGFLRRPSEYFYPPSPTNPQPVPVFLTERTYREGDDAVIGLLQRLNTNVERLIELQEQPINVTMARA